MNKQPFWKKDWFVGLLAASALLSVANSDLIQRLEYKAYDLEVMASSRIPSDKIAVIAIDEQSIAKLGPWPWPREIHARMVDILASSHAGAIGYTPFFFDPQVDAGLGYIHKIAGILGKSYLLESGATGSADTANPQGTKTPASTAHPEKTPVPPNSAESAQLDFLLLEAAKNLNQDKKLGESLSKTKEIVLPMLLIPGEPQGKPDKPLPDYVARNNLVNVKDTGGLDAHPLSSRGALSPIPALVGKTISIGHMNKFPDMDGAVRTEPLVMGYYNQYYPSLSLMLVAKSLNLQPKDISISLGENVQVGNQKISTDPSMRMHTYFYKDTEGRPAFQVDSFHDVLSGKIPANKYRGKIVLVGESATGAVALQATPVSSGMPPVFILAHSVSSILNGDFFVSPDWGMIVTAATFLLIAFYLIIVLPDLTSGIGILMTGALLVSLLAAHFVLMTTQAMWLHLMLPTLLLLSGHLLLATKRLLLNEKDNQISGTAPAWSNLTVGLAFQGQGQLDKAFEKFRNAPVDDNLLEVLYNLGLDFERKGDPIKAESVFKYLAEYNPKFRDLPTRLSRPKSMSETVIINDDSPGKKNPTNTATPAKKVIPKPMLGRYEIEKEIGKGAMGVVYYGKDTKIGRGVAIKTMALSQEFEADELDDVKERFFREAETAGRLSHPNIVSIYDVGEEHDLAYIAMEFLKGKDLIPYTRPENLLPLSKVMSIIARVADALDYAHKQNVVHRDIKPANIMYDPTTDTPKVTDFGIARITDSSKTKTGMVLGTPSFMSPEQLAGKKIGGGSDLFSLGVSLYQLACGKLPFSGDSMAQLMYRIANEGPADILEIRKDLPPCFVAIIDKSLSKRNEDRYATGAEMADALRQCAASLMKG